MIVLVGRGGGAVQNVQYIIRYANDLAWVTFFRVRNVCTCALIIIIIINGIREHYEPKTAARRQYIYYTVYSVYLPYIIICLLYYYAYCIILCMWGSAIKHCDDDDDTDRRPTTIGRTLRHYTDDHETLCKNK